MISGNGENKFVLELSGLSGRDMAGSIKLGAIKHGTFHTTLLDLTRCFLDLISCLAFRTFECSP